MVDAAWELARVVKYALKMGLRFPIKVSRMSRRDHTDYVISHKKKGYTIARIRNNWPHLTVEHPDDRPMTDDERRNNTVNMYAPDSFQQLQRFVSDMNGRYKHRNIRTKIWH